MTCSSKPLDSDSSSSSLQPPASSLALPIVSRSPSQQTGADTDRLPRWLKRQVPLGNGNHFTEPADRRVAAGDGVRQRQVPQSHGVLEPADRHVHDPGQRVHAAVRLLLGAQGQDRGAGRRRAGARGRGRRAAGAEARRDHLRDARRSARRRRGAFLSLGAGRARADGSRRRGAHARLHRQAGRDRTRGRSRARGVQSQHRNRAAAVSPVPRPQERLSLDAGVVAPRQAIRTRTSKPRAA